MITSVHSYSQMTTDDHGCTRCFTLNSDEHYINRMYGVGFVRYGKSYSLHFWHAGLPPACLPHSPDWLQTLTLPPSTASELCYPQSHAIRHKSSMLYCADSQEARYHTCSYRAEIESQKVPSAMQTIRTPQCEWDGADHADITNWYVLYELMYIVNHDNNVLKLYHFQMIRCFALVSCCEYNCHLPSYHNGIYNLQRSLCIVLPAHLQKVGI